MLTFIGDTPRLSLHCGIDISTFTTLEIKYKKPDETIGHWDATLDPLDHTHMFYDIQDSDLDKDGVWVVQAHVAKTGSSLHGDWAEFHVHKPLTEVVP